MSNTEYIKKLFNFENYVIEVLGLLTCYIQSLRNQYSINRKKKCIYLSSCCINCQIHPDSSLFQFLSHSAAVPQINIHWPLVSYNQTTSALYSLEPIGFYRIALSKKKKKKNIKLFHFSEWGMTGTTWVHEKSCWIQWEMAAFKGTGYDSPVTSCS